MPFQKGEGGKFVTLENPTARTYVDLTPGGVRWELKPGEHKRVPIKLAKWFLGDFENPLYPLKDEMMKIYERNRYVEPFIKIVHKQEAPVEAEISYGD